jgi:hypothetical protein
MYLKSTARDSSIGAPRSGFGIADFCADRDIEPYDLGGGERPIPIADFVDYGHWYQERLVPRLERAQVTSVSDAPGGFRLVLDSGEELTARTVVAAAGVAPFPHVPDELRLDGTPEHSAKSLVSHASDHTDLTLLSGRRVAVVGAGQSALESAVLLREAGATVHLLARTDELSWAGPPEPGTPSFVQHLRIPPAPLGAGWPHLLLTRYTGAVRYLPTKLRLEIVRRILGPFGAWWLRERFAQDIDVRLGRKVLGVDRTRDAVGVRLSSPDGEEHLEVDHVIAATGYRVEVDRLGFLSPELRARVARVQGYPALGASFESSVEGLFFSGLPAAATFGPALRFVYGSTFAGRRVAAGVARRAGS